MVVEVPGWKRRRQRRKIRRMNLTMMRGTMVLRTRNTMRLNLSCFYCCMSVLDNPRKEKKECYYHHC